MAGCIYAINNYLWSPSLAKLPFWKILFGRHFIDGDNLDVVSHSVDNKLGVHTIHTAICIFCRSVRRRPPRREIRVNTRIHIRSPVVGWRPAERITRSYRDINVYYSIKLLLDAYV